MYISNVDINNVAMALIVTEEDGIEGINLYYEYGLFNQKRLL